MGYRDGNCHGRGRVLFLEVINVVLFSKGVSGVMGTIAVAAVACVIIGTGDIGSRVDGVVFLTETLAPPTG